MSQGCQDPRTMEATKHAALGSLSYPTWLGVHRMVREVWYFRPQHIPPSHGGSRMESFWVPIAHLVSPSSRVRAQPLPLLAPRSAANDAS